MGLKSRSIYVVAAIFIFSCSTKPNIQVHSHGIINNDNNHKSAFINLTQFNSFDQLIRRVENIVCNDSIPTIIVRHEGVEKRIGLANACRKKTACVYIKRRNVLKIQDEKIQLTEPVALDSLETYISKHYNNHGKSYLFSENPRKASIAITYKDLPIAGLQTLLLKIIASYEKQPIEAPLMLTLDKPIPPPPF